MPSQLINLRRTLAWSDFQGNPPANTTWAAMTSSAFEVTPPTFQRLGAGRFQLVDQVTVRVAFYQNRSWRINMAQWPSQLQQDLLEHEQGHYDITALNARDCFIHLMQLKNSVWANGGDGSRDFNDWITIYRDRNKKIQDEYDDKTGHSQANVFVPSTNTFTPPVASKSSTQAKWERLIASAFTAVRPSGETAPDGTPYKLELMDVLKNAGIFQP